MGSWEGTEGGAYQLQTGVDAPAVRHVCQETQDQDIHVGIRARLQEALGPVGPRLAIVGCDIAR